MSSVQKQKVFEKSSVKMQKKYKMTAALLLSSEFIKKKNIMTLSKKSKKHNLSLLISVKICSFSIKPSVKMQKKHKMTAVLLSSSKFIKEKDIMMLSKKLKKYVFSLLTSVKIYFFDTKIKPALHQPLKDIKLPLNKIYIKRQARDGIKNTFVKCRASGLQ